MLSNLPSLVWPDLLVGHSTNDDAAVMSLGDGRAIVQTVDFFTPIVDDPELFGAIAAANSISDIYAMGATPIVGLAIAGFPTDKLPLSQLEAILRGGAGKAAEAGFPVAGGHTIIDEVPKYGLAVTGIVETHKIVRNSTAVPGDALFLTKPIGNGILVSAHRALSGRRGLKNLFRRGHPPNLDDAIEWMVLLNRQAATAMTEAGVSAATDVTGYGLIGHLLEMCRGSGAGAVLHTSAVPVLGGARELLAKGFLPAGTKRNVESFRSSVSGISDPGEFDLLCDAQTSGGLLIAVDPSRASQLEQEFIKNAVFYEKIGEMTDRSGTIELVR